MGLCPTHQLRPALTQRGPRKFIITLRCLVLVQSDESTVKTNCEQHRVPERGSILSPGSSSSVNPGPLNAWIGVLTTCKDGASRKRNMLSHTELSRCQSRGSEVKFALGYDHWSYFRTRFAFEFDQSPASRRQSWYRDGQSSLEGFKV